MKLADAKEAFEAQDDHGDGVDDGGGGFDGWKEKGDDALIGPKAVVILEKRRWRIWFVRRSRRPPESIIMNGTSNKLRLR